MLILPPSSPERQCRSSCISLWTRSRRWGFSTCPAAPWPARSRRSAGDILKVEIRWHSQSWDHKVDLKISFRGSESFLVLNFPWSGSSRLRVGGVTVALQIKSGWLPSYLGPSVFIFLLPDLLWIGGSSLSALVSMALFMDPQSNNDTENINCWQFLLAGMT